MVTVLLIAALLIAFMTLQRIGEAQRAEARILVRVDERRRARRR